MNKFISLVKRAPRRTSALVAALVAVVAIPVAMEAWGPTRNTFTPTNPAPYITFNSMVGNTAIGDDERNFVGIRESGSANAWTDNQKVEHGKEYVVRMYVHNNAASNLNLVAENVTAKVNLPTSTAKSIQVNGFISASNMGRDGSGALRENIANNTVYDHATFSGDRDFNVALVPGSVKYENNRGTFNLPETIFTSAGAKLGYEAMDGRIPGCFQYAGYVTFKVKAQVSQVTDFTLSKKVSKHGENKWVEDYTAKPGEVVDFALQYQNTGDVQQDDVTFRDVLPAGLTYVAGSTKWGNARGSHTVTDNDGNLTNGKGINVGSYAGRQGSKTTGAWVTFSAKVADESKLECGENTLRNLGRVTTGGYKVEDTATVKVNKECAPEPVITCDGLSVTKIDRTKFKFDTAYTIKNATLKHITYVVKDASGKEVYRGQNAEFTATTAGKYTVSSHLVVTVNGTDRTVTSNSCVKTFEVVEEPKNIQVCELSSKKIITIKESDFDSSKHSRNLEDCKEKPVEPKVIEVCEKETKKIVKINEGDFDSSKHTTNLSECAESPTTPPVTPNELPKTGLGDAVAAFIGLGALVLSVSYYVVSRRALGA